MVVLFWHASCTFPQASLSLPGTPFDKRRSGSQYSVTWARNDKRYGDRMPLMLKNLDPDLPFADESDAASPVSEESGAVLATSPLASVPHSRHSSYTSHCSRISYTSHGDVYGPRGDGNGGPALSWARDKGARCYKEVGTKAPVSPLTSFHSFLSLRVLLALQLTPVPSFFLPRDQSDNALSHSQTTLFGQDLILDPEEYMMAMKHRSLDNPFLDRRPSNKQTLVDMRGNLLCR